MKKPTIEELKNGLGRTIMMFGKLHYRIIDVKNDYLLLDMPEQRCYFTNGKLTPMPHKKIYFNTRNPAINVGAIDGFDDEYDFKMATYSKSILVVKKEEIEPNELPSIEQSKKLKPKVERRDKKTIERDKLLGVSASYLSHRY